MSADRHSPLDEIEPMSGAQIDVILPFLPLFSTPGFQACSLTEAGRGLSKKGIPMPLLAYSQELKDFLHQLYALGIVTPFDWPEWQRKEQSYSLDKIATADSVYLRKLLTVLVRKERFCEGTLQWAFQNGVIVAILHRLKQLRSELQPSEN